MPLRLRLRQPSKLVENFPQDEAATRQFLAFAEFVRHGRFGQERL